MFIQHRAGRFTRTISHFLIEHYLFWLHKFGAILRKYFNINPVPPYARLLYQTRDGGGVEREDAWHDNNNNRKGTDDDGRIVKNVASPSDSPGAVWRRPGSKAVSSEAGENAAEVR